MSDKIEVVKIKSSHPPTQGPFILLNKSDFDPAKGHELYTEGAPVPPPPAAVAPPVPLAVAQINAHPDAIALAADLGVDIASVVGTGKEGKITVEDVEFAAEKLTGGHEVEGEE